MEEQHLTLSVSVNNSMHVALCTVAQNEQLMMVKAQKIVYKNKYDILNF